MPAKHTHIQLFVKMCADITLGVDHIVSLAVFQLVITNIVTESLQS